MSKQFFQGRLNGSVTMTEGYVVVHIEHVGTRAEPGQKIELEVINGELSVSVVKS